MRVAGTGATIVLPLTHAPGLHGAQPLTGVPPCTEQPPLAQRQVTEWAALAGVWAGVRCRPPSGTRCAPGLSSIATSRLPSASAAATASAAAYR